MDTQTPAGGVSIARGGLSIRTSLIIAIIGALGAAFATVVVLRNEYGTGVEVLIAAIALGAFGIAAYGILQAVLGVIDTAGERRRQDREVSERRKGERARQPRK